MPSRPPEQSGLPRVSWLDEQGQARVELADQDLPCLAVVFDGAARLAAAAGPTIELRREDGLLVSESRSPSALVLSRGSAMALRLRRGDFEPAPYDVPFRDPFVWRVACVLRGEALGGSDAPSGFCESLMDALERHLWAKSTATPADGAGRGVGGATLHRAVVGMHEQMHERLRVDRLAESLGMGSARFGRGFKRQTGLSPSQYFVRMRVDCAKQMLAENRSLSETWLDCGFYDQAHFSRHFKRLVGVSPTQFLKRNTTSDRPTAAQDFS